MSIGGSIARMRIDFGEFNLRQDFVFTLAINSKYYPTVKTRGFGRVSLWFKQFFWADWLQFRKELAVQLWGCEVLGEFNLGFDLFCWVTPIQNWVGHSTARMGSVFLLFSQFVVQSLVRFGWATLIPENYESAVQMAASSEHSATVQDFWSSDLECEFLFSILLIAPYCWRFENAPRSESEEEPEQPTKSEKDIAPIFDSLPSYHECTFKFWCQDPVEKVEKVAKAKASLKGCRCFLPAIILLSSCRT